MDSFYSPGMEKQAVIFWFWIAVAVASVFAWNYSKCVPFKPARYCLYIALIALSAYILAFRIHAIEYDRADLGSILPQLWHLGGRVGLKAVFFLVLLVQAMKLAVHLWSKCSVVLIWWIAGFALAVALYACALFFSWNVYVKWLLAAVIAAIGFGFFTAWWNSVHDAYGLKLEAHYRRFRSFLVGTLLPGMWVTFLYKFRITRPLMWLIWLIFPFAGYILAERFGVWTGEKTLPHLFGLGFGPHWYQQDSLVLLPFLVLAGSVFAFAVCGYILFRGFRFQGRWAMQIAAATGCLMFVFSWDNYWLTIRKQGTDLEAVRKDVRGLSPQASPEKHALLTRYRRLVEYRLGTREWNAMVFHRLADEPFGLPYRFPGFLIGVEQANRYLIGVPAGDEAKGPDEELHDLLDNRRRTFVSHIAEFRKRGPDTADAEIVSTGMLYNLYESPDYDDAYTRGFREMDNLKDTLSARLLTYNGAPGEPESRSQAKPLSNPMGYTHFLVYCMGWNTDQQESIRNYNSLMGFLHAAAREDRAGKDSAGIHAKPFRPLVIGLSWPSEWSYLKPLSYLAKAGDADETGLVWGSYLLKNVIKPLKDDYKLPVVLVGHSFGTRVLSRAVASHPDWRQGVRLPTAAGKMDSTNTDVDLFVGLQGAFNANRFVRSGKLTSGWMDAGQYLGLNRLGTRFILTWSDADAANPVAAYATGANHVGGKFGHWFGLQHDTTFWPCVYSGKDGIAPAERWKYPDDNRFDSDTGWTRSAIGKTGRIFSLDLFPIVKEQPYGKGGGAHSDIYTPEIGRFLWKTILAFAPGEFKDPDSSLRLGGGKKINAGQ